jgi:hypothetical protein
MFQHFLTSAQARSLSLAKVLRMSDAVAEAVFVRTRFAANDGKPFCPNCGCLTVYECRQPDRTALPVGAARRAARTSR